MDLWLPSPSLTTGALLFSQSMKYPQARPSDIPAMARIRAAEWGTEEYWSYRISGYMNGTLHPQQALLPRIIYIACEGNSINGFIAGHLTRRFNCEGELQWINVIPAYRGKGIAEELLYLLARWFGEQKVKRICVDAGGDIARRFYLRHGANELNHHWLIWDDISLVLANKK